MGTPGAPSGVRSADRVEQALHVLAACHEPDVAGARSRLASRAGSAVRLRRRRVRPRVWVTLAAATVAIVGVGALWAVGRPSESPAAQTDPPLAPSVEPPTTTFVDAPSAGIAGVDARVVVTPVSAQVAWLTEGRVRVVSGVGDVDAEQ